MESNIIIHTLLPSINEGSCIFSYLILPRVSVMVDNKLVVVLAPCEDVRPVRKVISYDRQPVTPCLDDGLHIMQRVGAAMDQSLMDLTCLL